MVVIFEVCNHFFTVVDMVMRNVTIIFFPIVVLNQYFKIVLMGTFYLFFVPSLCYKTRQTSKVKAFSGVIKINQFW